MADRLTGDKLPRAVCQSVVGIGEKEEDIRKQKSVKPQMINCRS